MRFYNSLSRKKGTFKPRTETVKMYNCGPTVYGRQHIGNLRSTIIWDTLRRVLEWNGFKVKQVINITDFGHLTSDADEGEDKMAKGLRHENLPFTLPAMKKLGKKYTKTYLEDRKKLNTLSPTHLPFASKHIKEEIEFIKGLEKKGFTYATSDGIYFDTKKFPSYGKLGGLSQKKESRIGLNHEKKSSRDFALWKFNKKIGWQSPWGRGFPGWHIECSAMSKIFLGETFDIHTGGIEHIPIHHNNEIAQSEALHKKPLAKFWLHNEHLILSKGPKSADAERARKMAKSKGNVVYLKDIEGKGLDPLSLKYLFLTAHYRSPIYFSWEALESAGNALERLRNYLSDLSSKKEKPVKTYLDKFTQFLNDDLDTPKALALAWQLMKDTEVKGTQKRATILEFDKVLGLNLAKKPKKTRVPASVKELVKKREAARKDKDWKEADRLREQIKRKGFKVKDTNKGPILSF
jgi:cysteinyl-tRNA synthetase